MGNINIIEADGKKYHIVHVMQANEDNAKWLEKHNFKAILDNLNHLFLIGIEIEDAQIISESFDSK